MVVANKDMYVLAMNGLTVLSSGGPATRLGQLVVAGEVIDDVPVVDGPLRTMDAYVLSVLVRGRGRYRHADGRTEQIRPGAHTMIRPGVAHWYGTVRGQRWTELFAVFSGPLFDLYAEHGVLSTDGPYYPEPPASPTVLRAVLTTPARNTTAAEHQLLGLADWLLDATRRPTPDQRTPAITTAAERLGTDLTASLDLRSVAAEAGMSYDVFRRRFAAETGEPPAHYRNSRRLQTAATLLRHTDLTLRRIARTLGYTDEFHLSRRFRARFGVPPSRYRD